MQTTRCLLASLITLFLLTAARASENDNQTALVSRYEEVANALVADNVHDARAAACVLAVDATHAKQNEVAQAATAVGKAPDLAAAREAFKTLSARVIALARHEKGYFIVNCPMANADWLQSTRKIANPYFGQAMSACGSITAETKG